MIYFDNAATTPPYPEVVSEFSYVSSTFFGNSESNHFIGREASKKLEEARKKGLSLLNVSQTHNLLFTSGATESNNLALKGVAIQYQNRGKKILVSSLEHPSVYRPLDELEKLFGFKIVRLKSNKDGQVDLEDLSKKIDKDVILVSIMAVNNEIGSKNDLEAISKIIKEYPKCFFHVDATQALGKIDLPISLIDLLSFSSHKFGGIKGSGGLIYRKNIKFMPILAGGEQESGFRSGTVNLAGAVSTVKALDISLKNKKETYQKVKEIYEYLWNYFADNPEQYLLHSKSISSSQTPFVLNVGFAKKKASVIVEALSNKEIYVSSVSACSTKEAHASATLLSLGYPFEEAENSIRISFGSANTLDEAKIFVTELEKTMKEVVDR